MSDNNWLIAVLGIGGLLLFINSADDEKVKILKKQQVAGGGNQAVVQNPTAQQKVNRSAASADLVKVIQRYTDFVKWENENETALQKEMSFPDNQWLEVLSMRSALINLGNGLGRSMYRNVKASADIIFWSDFDKLIE